MMLMDAPAGGVCKSQCEKMKEPEIKTIISSYEFDEVDRGHKLLSDTWFNLNANCLWLHKMAALSIVRSFEALVVHVL